MTLSLLSYLRDDQAEIIRNPAKVKIVTAGRRWGKTFTAGLYILTVAEHGGACAWIAPTYKNARPLWRFCESITNPQAVKINKSEHEMTFPTGGHVTVYSADNDVGIRGEAFDLVIIDEAARINESTYTDVVLPTIADKDGRVLLISTPKGKNWFYSDYNLALSDTSGFSKAWHAPSSDNPSPNIRHAVELAAQRVKEGRLTERSYQQEWLAMFVEGGAFFQNVRECAILQPSTPEQHQNHQVYIGGDFAQQDDYTWLTALCATCNQMLEYQRFNQLSWTIQLERIKAFCNRWGHKEKIGQQELWQPAIILPERNSIGSVLIEQMMSAGIPVLNGPDGKPGFMTTAQTKQVLVKTLYAQLASMSLKILNDTILIAELESFEESPTAYGATYSAPSGLHDDGVISLSLANYAAQRSGIQVW